MVYNTNVIGTLNICRKRNNIKFVVYHLRVYAYHTPFINSKALVELEYGIMLNFTRFTSFWCWFFE